MQITLDLSALSVAALTDIGNALSLELDSIACGDFTPPASPGVDHKAVLTSQFMAVANEFARRGLERSDYLNAPNSL